MPRMLNSTVAGLHIVQKDETISARDLRKKLAEAGFDVDLVQARGIHRSARRKLDLVGEPTRKMGSKYYPERDVQLTEDMIRGDPGMSYLELHKKLTASGSLLPMSSIKNLFGSTRAKLGLTGQPTREGKIRRLVRPAQAERRLPKPTKLKTVSVTTDDAFSAVKTAFELASMVPELQNQIRKLKAVVESYDRAAREKKNETLSYALGVQQGEIKTPSK